MLPLGLYRHVKGGLYVVEQLVLNCTNNTHDATYVLYWSVKIGAGKKFVRDLEEFTELVRWSDGSRKPRFIQEIL
jgi:hypothetical protein